MYSLIPSFIKGQVKWCMHRQEVWTGYGFEKGSTWSRTKILRLCYHFEADNERSTIEFESSQHLLIRRCTCLYILNGPWKLYRHSILCVKCPLLSILSHRFQLPRIIRGSHGNWHQKPATYGILCMREFPTASRFSCVQSMCTVVTSWSFELCGGVLAM
jgi:hypothetical protein